MPPANTPQATPPQSEHELDRLLPDQSFLEPSLAQQNNDANSENIRFLRTPLEIPTHSSSSTSLENNDHTNRADQMELDQPSATVASESADSINQGEERQSSDGEQRLRLQRVLARLSRRHDWPPTSSYSERIPPPAQQSLYDWAPQQDSVPDDDQGLEEILTALQRQNPGTHSDILEFLARRQLYRQREHDDHARTRWRSQQTRSDTPTTERRNDSLRSAAILQHARASASIRTPSGTERMLRYLRNRERAGQTTGLDQETVEPIASAHDPATDLSDSQMQAHHEINRIASRTLRSSFQPNTSSNITNADNTNRSTRNRNDARARIDAYRRGYLAENPSIATTSSGIDSSPVLENAVKYLDTLRLSSSSELPLLAFLDYGYMLDQLFTDNQDDLLTDLDQCPAPSVSSLLCPGAVFEGTQNTASSGQNTSSTLRSFALTSSIYSNEPQRTLDTTRPWLIHPSASPATLSGAGTHPSLDPSRASQDRWPVKVKIQDVDYERMTVAGIMEAYDVPTPSNSINPILLQSHTQRDAQSSHRPSATASCRKRAFPITTYLEGQIIDFSTHSFLTPASGSEEQQQNSSSISSSGRAAAARSSQGNNNTPYRPTTQGIVYPPTSAITDAANWRNLPPFNTMKTDEDVARSLLSRSAMTEIMSEWIFMRWKERCFIHSKTDSCQHHNHNQLSPGGAGPVMPPPPPSSLVLGEGDDTDTGHGLTISGFYYVSLRRSDGEIDGLYFDTKTSPYQHLKLSAKAGGLHGAWQFK
ncbi:hypothetical protein AAFC00_004705 [Neodothiora populina]|uniref:Vacuolar import and degradation protein-domain-containing protein n=1 Tax=Neodothiora populina TaxID=2781224 RepID=A0ABR3P342_9PEZI